MLLGRLPAGRRDLSQKPLEVRIGAEPVEAGIIGQVNDPIGAKLEGTSALTAGSRQGLYNHSGFHNPGDVFHNGNIVERIRRHRYQIGELARLNCPKVMVER
jgi:hypothetical protein